MSEKKQELNNDQYEANEKYRLLKIELEENRAKILDNRVK